MRFLLQPICLLCLCGPGGADAKGGQKRAAQDTTVLQCPHLT